MSVAPQLPALQVSDRELVGLLAGQVRQTLSRVLGNVRRLALLDFPNYANVGDSAIWLGTRACLRQLNLPRPCYTCDQESYSREELARCLGDGVILLQGGGNFGDLWESHQIFREEIIKSFPRHQIIFLPQSIHFQSSSALARARRVINAHPHITLLVRDHASLELARREFTVPSTLCPDMALCLGPQARPTADSGRIVWLGRSDKEARLPGESAVPGVRKHDWISEPRSWRATLNRALTDQYRRRPRLQRWAPAPLVWSRERLAQWRLARGCALLSSGRAVITDRLHGHILCLLMGIPHYLLDNNTGKVRAFHDTWTRASQLTRWCANEAEAARLASLELKVEDSAGPWRDGR